MTAPSSDAQGRPARRALPIVGGNVALDFGNTVDDPLGPTRHDHLTSYEDLLHWALRLQVLTDTQAEMLGRAALRRPGEARAGLARGLELRVLLNETFGAVARGEGNVAELWPRLRPFATDAIAAAALSAGTSGLRWVWPSSDDLAVPLHPVAWAAAELLRSPDLGRVKQCAGCPWLFLDRSRNHSRRWCDMADCGTVEKSRRFVSRRSAAPRAPRGAPAGSDGTLGIRSARIDG